MISKIRQTILSIAIAIVFAMFVGYGISTFYDQPEYKDYCTERIDSKLYSSQAACEEVGGKWTARQYECPEGQECALGFCNPSFTCREDLSSARETYDRNVFIITLVIGLTAIIVGGIFVKIEAVGSGIMGGGVLTVIYGTLRYWGHAPDALRFTILGVVLAVLVWIGYSKIKGEVVVEKKTEKKTAKKAKKKKK